MMQASAPVEDRDVPAPERPASDLAAPGEPSERAAASGDPAGHDPQELRPMCPVACRILDEVRARLDWQHRQRSRATCPPRVRYADG